MIEEELLLIAVLLFGFIWGVYATSLYYSTRIEYQKQTLNLLSDRFLELSEAWNKFTDKINVVTKDTK
ncbi:MAG: hypothetical protein LHW59_05410 [Candidatus Cloacimonetes bacterium]|nr:hypothetical protein [Candidatus Cloacimonadota bacterium]